MKDVLPKRHPASCQACAILMLALLALAVFSLAHVAPAHADGTAPVAASSALTVNRADDADESGTLRWALGRVNAGEAARIEFDTTAMGASPVIELESELPIIKSAVVIAGPADGKVTIKKASTASMPSKWRHLNINGASGAFDVSISNVIFEGPNVENTTVDGLKGGIFVDNAYAGTLTLTNCKLWGNVSELRGASSSEEARGGAINVLSTKAKLRMKGCAVEGNIANSYGGGVHSASPVYAEDCQFLNNESKNDFPGGGALCADEVELMRCDVKDNRSEGGAGGGVKSSTLTMTDCVVSDNRLGSSERSNKGGGVYAVDLVMTGCEVRDNVNSGGQGAGIYASNSAKITNSIVSGNLASGRGGGAVIVLSGVVESSDFTNNESGSQGGGIVAGDEAGPTPPTLKVVDSTIEGNMSKGAGGGGGIFAYGKGALTLTNTVISKNETTSLEGGGGIYGHEDASLNMTDCQVVGNKAEGHRASDNAPFASGGGVHLVKGKAVLERCLVAENTAAVQGGGLFVTELTARDVQLSRNTAADAGGGVFASRSLEASGSTFDGNTAKAGGALSAPDAALTNCTVFGNTASVEGGGVAGQKAKLVNCTVSGNVSGAGAVLGITGGGVLATTLDMFGSIVAGNHDADGNPSELAVGSTVDNGNGTVADSHGKKNIVGVPAGGLGTIFKTQTVSGREVAVLENNGGPTTTIVIAPDGPAQDVVAKGDYAVPTTDQRGVARPTGPAADIGAVEVSGLSLTYSVEKTFDVYRGGDQPLTGKAEAPLRSVLGVQVGGTTLEPGKHYTLSEGSTVVTLTPAYLKTLKDGTYQVVVSFTNGSATLPLQVELPKPKPDDPIGPDDPTDPDDPVDPDGPTDPDDPVDPDGPTDPIDPTDPVKPVDPTDPVQPTKPADPAQLVKLTDPVPPAKPTVLARMGDDAAPIVVTLALAAAAAAALGVARRRLG